MKEKEILCRGSCVYGQDSKNEDVYLEKVRILMWLDGRVNEIDRKQEIALEKQVRF